MGGPAGHDPKDSSRPRGQGQTRRKRRRRTLLNLGMPFAQIDDFLNQSEEAVALGYQVLESTVTEIRDGYREAVAFNKKRQANEDEPIPWTELVSRAQNLQKIALDATRKGTEILFDAIEVGNKSIMSAAATWQQSRSDADVRSAGLAGPVIEEVIEITGSPGGPTKREQRLVRHRGLARLRIYAEVDPKLTELRSSETEETPGELFVRTVTFEPDSEQPDEVSVLTVEVGDIRRDQKPAIYEGCVRAKNFDLLIAKLRVVIEPAPGSTRGTTQRQPGTRYAAPRSNTK